MTVKQQILQIIFDRFSAWMADEPQACEKGCSACCSRNVTITGLEGERILGYILEQDEPERYLENLQSAGALARPKLTTNGFAQACLAGQDAEPEEQAATAPCPFLENDLCTIYPARPFACRCFVSNRRCSPSSPALVADHYPAGSTTALQLIEHLGQGEYWGNMLDVLPALMDISAYRSLAEHLRDKSAVATSRMHLLTAKPLPGFLLTEEDYKKVSPLLEDIFNRHVDGKSIEDILNGR